MNLYRKYVVSSKNFPNLRKYSARLISLFGNTYLPYLLDFWPPLIGSRPWLEAARNGVKN